MYPLFTQPVMADKTYTTVRVIPDPNLTLNS